MRRFYSGIQKLYFKDLLGPIETNFKIQEKLISLVAKREGPGSRNVIIIFHGRLSRGVIFFSCHRTSDVSFS